MAYSDPTSRLGAGIGVIAARQSTAARRALPSGRDRVSLRRKMAGSSFSSVIAFGASVWVMGCASGPVSLVGYKVPQWQQVAIAIDISDQVNQADQSGAVSTLADRLSDRLKEHGIFSQLYSSSKYDHPKPPRIDVFVSNWHGTPTVARWAFAPAAWNSMVVECRVMLPGQSKPAFSRHFEHTSAGSMGSETDNAAAEGVADEIVNAILKH